MSPSVVHKHALKGRHWLAFESERRGVEEEGRDNLDIALLTKRNCLVRGDDVCWCCVLLTVVVMVAMRIFGT
jgi:hypothetical protein